MKINVYHPKIENSIAINTLIKTIFDNYANDHNFDLYNKLDNNHMTYVQSAKGIQSIVGWLKDLGWKVNFWYIGPSYMGKDIAYRFDFDKTCPFYIEAVLKCHEG